MFLLSPSLLKKCHEAGFFPVVIDHFQEIPQEFTAGRMLVVRAQHIFMLVCTRTCAKKLGVPIPTDEFTFQGVWEKIRRNQVRQIANGCCLVAGVCKTTCGDTPWEDLVMVPIPTSMFSG